MDTINIIRQGSKELLHLEHNLLKLIDTKPMRVPEKQTFIMDYLKGLGATLGCGLLTLQGIKEIILYGDFLFKLFGFVLTIGFGLGTFAGVIKLKATKKEEADLQQAREEAENFNANLESEKKTFAEAYNSLLSSLRTTKQQVPELKDHPVFFDRDFEHIDNAGFSYRSIENSFVIHSGEPVLRKSHFNHRDTLILDGQYPDKHCLVREAMDSLEKEEYYYLVKDDVLIEENQDTICNFNLITDNRFFTKYLTYHTGGDTSYDPDLRLKYMYSHYTQADRLILSGTGYIPNLSSVPDTRAQQMPPTKIPEYIDYSKAHHLHKNYEILTLRLGYVISIPNPWRILCIAVPKFPVKQQNWAINQIQGSPFDHLVGELIATYDEIMEKANVDAAPVDPIRVAEYLVSYPELVEEMPPFDPLSPPPNGMNPNVWRAILRTWSTALPVIESDTV